MLIYSLFIKGINLRCLGNAASRHDVPGNRFHRRQAVPGKKKPGSFACESSRDGAADSAACPIDYRYFVFQVIHNVFFSVEKLQVNPSRCLTKTFGVTFPDIFRTIYLHLSKLVEAVASPRIVFKK
jgi:hypothetical protein